MMKKKHLSLIGIVLMGASVLFSSNVGAVPASRSGVNVDARTVNVETNDLMVQTPACPKSSGGSLFAQAETRNSLIFICGGNKPNTYIAIAKNDTTGGIMLPLYSYGEELFVAANGNIRYILSPSELVVTHAGRALIRERVEWKN